MLYQLSKNRSASIISKACFSKMCGVVEYNYFDIKRFENNSNLWIVLKNDVIGLDALIIFD